MENAFRDHFSTPTFHPRFATCMDDRDKSKMAPPDDPDEGELELEPIDPAIIAAEQRRAQETVDATRVSIDIDEIYREAEHDRGQEILHKWVGDLRFHEFRFQTKHLLILTAVV